MSNPGIFRNINIIKELNASTSTAMIELYQPGTLNSLDIVNNAKYSGFVTSLRLTIDIISIDELEVVENDILADDATIAANAKTTFNNNPKKCLSFFIGNSNTPPIKVADIFVFNQRPFYYLSLLPYFTSASTFDVAPDSIIAVQQRDVGYGLLQDEDRVLILGSVIEESPTYDQSVLTIE
ncbi:MULTISPECIES: hypothetical protein [unclassified Nostoc]|uniref:hypothetical protein n=1 Tax=unclassified Nostoc TaxID=2593658 RepID=UPI002AD259EB|nr:hypothetical protein [Nostoc sp. DedQUE03]MDZ7971273.1 hypothetical protein [Nostoc sp. DedQUE03]MDZ8045465.1 hypothetical protein [Nostoc sp. DedQUE02]